MRDSPVVVRAYTLAVVAFCVVLPWVHPWAAGPSASVQPWLVAAACVAVLVLVRGWQFPGWPLSVWAACALLAIAGGAGMSLEVVARWTSILIVLMAAGAAASDRRDMLASAIAAAWLAAAVISSAIALCQYFGWSEAFAPWISPSSLGEAYANLRQPNQLASLLSIGLVALVWFIRRGLGLGAAVGIALLLAVASAASASRTGALQWLMLAALMAFWPGVRRREALQVIVAGLAAYVAASLLLPTVLEWTSGQVGRNLLDRFAAQPGCGNRTVLWSNVLHLIAQRPWSGWGWGELDYAHYATLYDGPRFCDIVDNAHNLPLHLAVELGVPVAAAFCLLLAWALRRAMPWREADPTRQMALAVLAVILLHSLVEYPLWYGPFQIAFGLSLGLLWPARAVSPLARFRWPQLMAAVALAGLAYATWDYHRISQIYLAPEARSPRYQSADLLPQLRESWLFRSQVRFAGLTITPLTRANAQWTYDTALDMLHYSPEPRVIEKVIESALILGRDNEVMTHLQRFRAAFPDEHAQWASEHGWPQASEALRN